MWTDDNRRALGTKQKQQTKELGMINLFNKVTGRRTLATTEAVILGSVIVGALALPLTTQAAQQQKKEHPRYKLIDLGTLGGPQYYGNFSGQEPRLLNNQ